MRAGGCMRIIVVCFLVWLLLMAVLVFTSIKLPVGGDERSTQSRVEKALEQIDQLKIQNQELREVLSDLKALQVDKNGNIETVMAKAQSLLGSQGAGLPPPTAYELLRYRLASNVREFWSFLSVQLKTLEMEVQVEKSKSQSVEHLYNIAKQHQQSLTKVVGELKEVDGYADWRAHEAKSLASLVQRRLYYLQNPADCNNARKLLCSLNKGCGFGCQIHHVAYCLIVAYATERTLVLNSKGWRYHKNGWEDVFKPLSDTCISKAGESRSAWPGKGDDTQVVVLPIIDTLSPRPDYLPPAVPEDLAPRLVRLHGKPVVWWIGQMLRFLMRPQTSTDAFLQKAKEKLKFQKPIVGVHIRRTDKIGTEASFHSLAEYMKHVAAWYEQQEYNGIHIGTKRIYLATDEPRVIDEAKERYPDYEILGDATIAKSAGMSTRYSDSSLNGILLDMYLLSLSDHLVCTFSSQVCRAAFELMQTYNADAADSFTSLDDVYYYGGQNAHSAITVIAHKPSHPSELELAVGDLVVVAGNHWDGYSKGRNLRTNLVGLYPSFKVEDRVKTAVFPTYNQVPKE